MIQKSHSQAYIQRKTVQKDTYTTVFTAALLTIANTWKHLKCPSTAMDKDVTHVKNGLLRSL